MENGQYHTRAEKETSSGSEEILRPISLTSCISKVGEGFVVDDYLKPSVLDVIYSSQLVWARNLQVLVLISMMDTWSLATDRKGTTVRTLLYYISQQVT